MLKSSEIINAIQNDVLKSFGKEDISVSSFGTLNEPASERIYFLKSADNFDANRLPKNSIIILPEQFSEDIQNEILMKESFGIVVEDPRLSFVRIISKFFAPKPPTGIHPTAIIDPTSKIGDNCYIGPYTVIGKYCIVGNGTTINSNIHIYDNIEIGNNCLIHSGAVIGTDGFGFQKNKKGEYEKFHHFGKVIIGNNVEIGGQTCIDRGTLGNTTIGNGCKIDNLVHIAHNVVVGENCTIIAHAMIGGSVRIGEGCWVGPSASIINQVTIGKNALIGISANVIKNVEENTVVAGNPAKPLIKQEKK